MNVNKEDKCDKIYTISEAKKLGVRRFIIFTFESLD